MPTIVAFGKKDSLKVFQIYLVKNLNIFQIKKDFLERIIKKMEKKTLLSYHLVLKKQLVMEVVQAKGQKR